MGDLYDVAKVRYLGCLGSIEFRVMGRIFVEVDGHVEILADQAQAISVLLALQHGDRDRVCHFVSSAAMSSCSESSSRSISRSPKRLS